MNLSALFAIIIVVVSGIIGTIYHEYGHLKAAKKHGITVHTFCIGYGKPFIKHKGKDGVIYGIAPLPFGSYCRLEGNELHSSSTRAYISVLMAGVLRNLIVGVLLIVIGQIFITGNIANPLILFQTAVSYFEQLITGFADGFLNIFNIKKIASHGGFVGHMMTVGEILVTMSHEHDINHMIGLSLVVGGMVNYLTAILNALPIPGFDGGQVVIRLINDFCKKVFKKEIKKHIIAVVNLFVMVAVCGYQAVLMLLDIPAVQQFFLNL